MQCPICLSNIVNKSEEFYNNVYNKKYIYYKCSKCNIEFSVPFSSAGKEHYEDSKLHDQWYGDRWEFGEVSRALNKNDNVKTVLEIGCGEGFFLGKLNSDKLKVGLDFNIKAIEIAKKSGLPNVHDMTLSEYRDKYNKKFDCICFFHLLEHLDRPYEFLSTCYNMLNDNGLLFLSVPSWKRIEIKYSKRENWDYAPHHLTRWSENAIRILIESFFSIEDIKYEPLNFSFKKSFLFNEQVGKINSINNMFLRKTMKLIVLPYVYTIYILNKIQHNSEPVVKLDLPKKQ